MSRSREVRSRQSGRPSPNAHATGDLVVTFSPLFCCSKLKQVFLTFVFRYGYMINQIEKHRKSNPWTPRRNGPDKDSRVENRNAFIPSSSLDTWGMMIQERSTGIVAEQDLYAFDMITKASADGTLFTQALDTQPLFPLPDMDKVNNESGQSSGAVSSLSKYKRSPSSCIREPCPVLQAVQDGSQLEHLPYDLYVEKMRFEAVRCVSRSYLPTLPVAYIAQVLGFTTVFPTTEASEEKDSGWIGGM
ncbi:hypothetical protein NE237_005182 [Protea cynaroides]|uniref:Uncharacterized protein n=1 Tax=Protea cynaroides TaxID=273540 RepID=A0A9Q0KK33_9MAGN|nr:hypothetical protein NE237_005182 [Protea cynaroides]